MSCRSSDWLCRAVDHAAVPAVRILLILVLAAVVARIGGRVAARSVRSLGARAPLGEPSRRAHQRSDTLAGVASSVVRIVVWAMAFLTALDQLRINLGPVLAGASIVGVALGFGAQSLVRDFLSGFFILAEDQFGVGDVVTVAEATGTVEEMNLRVTRLRGQDGTVWFVPNGEIRKVANAAKDWSRALVDVVVPYGVDVAAATVSIKASVTALASEPDWSAAILEPPEVLGIEALSADGATVRASVKTTPSQRAAVARALRARISAGLRQAGLVAAVKEPAKPAPADKPADKPGVSGPGAG